MTIYREFETSDHLEQAVAERLTHAFQDTAETPFAVMLTGGRTPLGVYRRLTEAPPAPAPSLHVIISDERHVPESSEVNNFAHIKPLLKAMGLPPERILSVRTDQPLEAAAEDYNRRLAAFIRSGGRFPLGLLGMGADGHTASLFPDTDLTPAAGRYAMAVRRPDGPNRVSVTPDLLRRVEKILVLCAGEEKREIVERFRHRPESVLAARLLADCPDVELWYAP